MTPDVSTAGPSRRPVMIGPGEPGYDEGRTGFDLGADPRPRAVVPATTVDDVVAAVSFARDEGLALATIATGHGPSTPVDDSALLVTTAGMTGVRVDPDRRTATIAAGTVWADVIAAAAEHGLAPLCGASAGVGVVSYTLGGGLGPLGRAHGFAADHVGWCEIVTPDGELRRIDATSEPELFWAVRGCGASFGVVTELEVALFPVAGLYGGGLFFAMADVDAVAPAFLESVASAPDTLTLSLALLTFPDLPVLPDPLRGKAICHVRVADSGDSIDDATAHVAPLRACATAVLDTVTTMPFTAVASINGDPTEPRPVDCRSMTVSRLDGDVLATIVDRARPGLPFLVEVRAMGGALERQPTIANAVGQRHAAGNVFTTAYDGTAPGVGSLQEDFLDAISTYRSGALLNFLVGSQVSAAEVRSCFEPATWRRLQELKGQVDPERMLRFHHGDALASPAD